MYDGFYSYKTSVAIYIHIYIQYIYIDIYDECCGTIDLFRVQNRVVHILPWWECWHVYRDYFMKDGRISGYLDIK